jgi:hypothetical protein
MKYKLTVVAEIEIEAENVVRALRLAKEVKVMGTQTGWGRPYHNRDPVFHSLKIKEVKRKLEKEK